MTIASEISRLQGAKADIKTAIESKGVTVPSSTKLDSYDDLIDSIQTGVPQADYDALVNKYNALSLGEGFTATRYSTTTARMYSSTNYEYKVVKGKLFEKYSYMSSPYTVNYIDLKISGSWSGLSGYWNPFTHMEDVNKAYVWNVYNGQYEYISEVDNNYTAQRCSSNSRTSYTSSQVFGDGYLVIRGTIVKLPMDSSKAATTIKSFGSGDYYDMAIYPRGGGVYCGYVMYRYSSSSGQWWVRFYPDILGSDEYITVTNQFTYTTMQRLPKLTGQASGTNLILSTTDITGSTTNTKSYKYFTSDTGVKFVETVPATYNSSALTLNSMTQDENGTWYGYCPTDGYVYKLTPIVQQIS